MHCKWLVTGAGGQLGSVLLRELTTKGEEAIGIISPAGPAPFVGRTIRVDITDGQALAIAVREIQPQFIVHTAAVTSVQAAFDDPARAASVNIAATAHMASLAADCGARLLYTSTDLVFDGEHAPYDEEAGPSPLSIYGRTKLEGERIVQEYGQGLVARLSLVYGVPGVRRATTFVNQLAAIAGGASLPLFIDEFRSPIWLDDAAKACIRIAQSDASGPFHIAGPQRLSRFEMGQFAARALDLRDAPLVPIRQWELEFSEPRPHDVSLDASKFAKVFGEPPGRPMAEAMQRIADEWRRRNA